MSGSGNADADASGRPAGSLARAPLAYENPGFLDSPDGRLLRIMAEYQEPMARFRRERIEDTVVFFGSARFRAHHADESALSEGHGSIETMANTGAALPGSTAHVATVPTAAVSAPAASSAAPDASADAEKQGRDALAEGGRYYEDARRLAHMVAAWARTVPGRRHRFVVTSGGGPGIMEAANRGAYEAGAKTIGLNIKLPFEQLPNPYVTPELNFEFHYFFMRKFYFAYMAKALVVFPGGFGTLDEMFEVLTLAQTHKLDRRIPVVIYGSTYWKSVLNFDMLVEKGAIAASDRDLVQFADTPEEAFEMLKAALVQSSGGFTGDDAHGIPDKPERNVQELLGPGIARTR